MVKEDATGKRSNIPNSEVVVNSAIILYFFCVCVFCLFVFLSGLGFLRKVQATQRENKTKHRKEMRGRGKPIKDSKREE